MLCQLPADAIATIVDTGYHDKAQVGLALWLGWVKDDLCTHTHTHTHTHEAMEFDARVVSAI